jgi:hypothetical protein
MHILTTHNVRWRIEKDHIVIFSGIGTVDQAIAIARSYGIVLAKIRDIGYLRAA